MYTRFESFLADISLSLSLSHSRLCEKVRDRDARETRPREMCEVWGRVCARSDSDRHSTRLRSKDATASQHTRTPTPCCCGTSRNPPVQALLCLDAPSDVEAAPFPSEHRKVNALGLPRERAHHCDNTLSSSCNQRWFDAFNTFAVDLPVVSVLRLAERARTPGHPACCSLAQVGQPLRWDMDM